MSIEKIFQRFPRLLFVVFLALTIAFSLRFSTAGLTKRDNLIFLPSPEYAERLSGTFRTSLALAFYMKGVLELAHDSHKKVDTLLSLFELAIKLDQKLTKAAFLGGVVVPSRAEDVPKAIAFLEEISRLLPSEWRIPYWIGYNYLEIENYEKTAEFYLKASVLPGAPPFLKFSPVGVLSRAESLERAFIQTRSLLESVDDEEDQAWILHRLAWLEQMQNLENKTREFKKLTGRFPMKLEELVEKGLLKEIPKDDFGTGFFLTDPGHPENGYRVRSL